MHADVCQRHCPRLDRQAAGPAASNTPRTEASRRGDTLPRPLPISSIAVARSTAPGNSTSARRSSRSARAQPAAFGRCLRRSNQKRLRAGTPQIVEYNVDACAEVWLERTRQMRVVLLQRHDGIRTRTEQCLQRSALRPVATTFAAPRCFAIRTASRPDVPVAPLTSTVSPATSRARSVSAAHDDIRESRSPRP